VGGVAQSGGGNPNRLFGGGDMGQVNLFLLKVLSFKGETRRAFVDQGPSSVRSSVSGRRIGSEPYGMENQ